MKPLLLLITFAGLALGQQHILPGDTCFSKSSVWPAPIVQWAPNFTCTLPTITPGDYQFTFTLQEPNLTGAGLRVFTISINGISTTPIDVYAMAKLLPVRIIQRVYIPVASPLVISFDASVRNAIVRSIDIVQVPPGTVGLPSVRP